MPKTILEKIKELQADPSYDELNTEIQPLVIKMILSLVGTDEWEEFIKHFTDNENPAQIARLTLNDDLKNDPWVKKTVAYLFANSVCGGTTGKRLHEGIENFLDVGIDYSR
jgi:hypothetical protein